jgi:hypothetical protein
MTAPSKIRDYVKLAVEQSGEMPEVNSYVTHEADPNSTDGNLRLPLVEIQQIDFSRNDLANTTKLGQITDDNGNEVGYAYETLYEVTLQISLWVADGSDHDVDVLGDRLRKVLFAYDIRGPDQDFVDEEGRPIETIYEVNLLSSSREDDTTQTPTARLWQQNIEIAAGERYTDVPDVDYIEAVSESV